MCVGDDGGGQLPCYSRARGVVGMAPFCGDLGCWRRGWPAQGRLKVAALYAICAVLRWVVVGGLVLFAHCTNCEQR